MNYKLKLTAMTILFAVALSGCAGYYAAGYSNYPYGGYGSYAPPYRSYAFRYHDRDRNDHHRWEDHHERHEGWR